MSKKLPITPNTRVRQALRQLWLRSRERAKALKDAKYCCSKCGVKQSKAKGREVKVEVHHKAGILNWFDLFDAVRKYLLVNPSMLEVLCLKCHGEEHELPEAEKEETL